MLARVFDMFTRVAPRQDHRVGGLGIGLTLVRRLVELHGGRASAYSRGPGQGSTFTISLPLLHVVHGTRAPGAAPAPAPPAGPILAQGARPRVLVVDDNKDAAETIAALIGRLGADVRIAHDGPRATEMAPAFEPHLVLLDIGLPGMDGYETARRLRQAAGLEARLVALTGYGSPQDRERALAAGFEEHLVKPLTLAAIQELLRKVAAMHAPS
jgi:CheY-like chemotaxis protein